MATSSSSSSSSKPSLSPHHLSQFTTIEEGNEDEEWSQGRSSFRTTTPTENYSDNKEDAITTNQYMHQHGSSSEKGGENSTRKRSGSEEENNHKWGVSCNNCRPSNREKISIVPLDNNNRLSITSPNGIFKNMFSSLVKKSPKSVSTDEGSTTMTREEQFKATIEELSHKLIHATRKRDEAIMEVSRLKYSMYELEKKVNKLEIYSQNLKSNLDAYGNMMSSQQEGVFHLDYLKSTKVGDEDKVIQHFLVVISDSRSSIRLLSRSLTLQLKQQTDGKKWVQKNAHHQILNPIDRCEANFALFGRLKGLTWEEVLKKGTRHFNEEFSKFCDKKMSEIVAMLGWNQAWPEPLLQVVDKDVRFDSVYMEDIGGDKARKLVPTMVKIMVTPGFYVYDNVVKCKSLKKLGVHLSPFKVQLGTQNIKCKVMETEAITTNLRERIFLI
ncbi:hypothetical protein Leryth_000368 [Lithospermum erythrorhizon]|nr:hypothetical protein Leryth_000368 [Lithospermum erythrorhizon]